MAHVQVLAGVERRRRWSEAQKRAIVSAAFAPGAVVSEVARRADLYPGQIYRWRRELEAASCFVEVVAAPAAERSGSPEAAAIELTLRGGAEVRIAASASPALAAAVIGALVR